MPRKAFFRNSTEEKMPDVEEASGRGGPNLKALVTEKSHASGPPLGPRGTHTSAGRREVLAGSGKSGSGGAILINRVTRNKKARLLKNCSQVGTIISSRVDDVKDEVVTREPIPSTPTSQSVIPPICPTPAHKVSSWSPVTRWACEDAGEG